MVDCDLIGSLSLPDALYIISVEDPAATVWIGCRTGFVLIGSAADLRDQLHRKTIDRLITLEERKRKTFRALVDHVAALGKWKESPTGKRLIDDMVTAEHDLRSFVPFEERSVKKCYRKISGDVVLIVEGGENTKIYTMEDYEKHHTRGA